jgi:hypothetical protein
MNNGDDPRKLIQRSEEWWQYRCGKVTASRLYDVVKLNQNGKPSAKRAAYLNELIGEIITGRPADMKSVRSLDERAALEPEARIAYSWETDNEVEEVGCIPHPTIGRFACSPDGLIRRSGGLEIKSLDAANHLRALEGDQSIIEEYLPQCNGNLACSGRKWWDLAFYHPYMPAGMKLKIVRVHRQPETIALLEAEVRNFLAEIDKRIAKVSGQS